MRWIIRHRSVNCQRYWLMMSSIVLTTFYSNLVMNIKKVKCTIYYSLFQQIAFLISRGILKKVFKLIRNPTTACSLSKSLLLGLLYILSFYRLYMFGVEIELIRISKRVFLMKFSRTWSHSTNNLWQENSHW